jgi:hypothetical protein
MGLERVQPIEILTAGEIFLPPVHCRFVVISDIDETVMETVVANNLKMLVSSGRRAPAPVGPGRNRLRDAGTHPASRRLVFRPGLQEQRATKRVRQEGTVRGAA